MYETFFHLQRSPFCMTPDPDCLFMTLCHREALSGLQLAVLKRSGFVVLTGGPGTGKTTLLASLIRSANRARFAVVLNPTLDSDEFLEFVLVDFGITDVPTSKAQRIIRLQELLVDLHEKGKVPVLIVDEAHKLKPEVLEEIRLFTNFESTKRKLLQIVLAGQSELADLLNRDDLRQVKQRIEIRLQVRPLARGEVGNYFRHRCQCAGGSGALPFSAEAISLVARGSRGIPRLVNSICDNALLLAHAGGDSWITVDQVRQVLRDLDLPDSHEEQCNSENPARPNGGTEQVDTTANAVPVPNLETFRPPYSGAPFIMRWASKLNLGTVQVVKTSQHLEV
jgi:general secretion pathway protein A